MNMKETIQSKYIGKNIVIEINKLHEIESISDIELSKWKKLTITGLIRDNKTVLDSFSVLFRKTKNIEELNFKNNELYTMPNNICYLVNLKKIDFKNNKLTSLPKDIGNLKNLKSLNLSGNELTELPK